MIELVDGICKPPPPPEKICDPPNENRVYPDCIPTPPLKCEAPYEDRVYPDCAPPCTEEMPIISSCTTTVPPVPIIIPPASCDEFTTKNAEIVK